MFAWFFASPVPGGKDACAGFVVPAVGSAVVASSCFFGASAGGLPGSAGDSVVVGASAGGCSSVRFCEASVFAPLVCGASDVSVACLSSVAPLVLGAADVVTAMFAWFFASPVPGGKDACAGFVVPAVGSAVVASSCFFGASAGGLPGSAGDSVVFGASAGGCVSFPGGNDACATNFFTSSADLVGLGVTLLGVVDVEKTFGLAASKGASSVVEVAEIRLAALSMTPRTLATD